MMMLALQTNNDDDADALQTNNDDDALPTKYDDDAGSFNQK